MTDAEINQLRDLLRAATPGPWALECKETSKLVSNGEVWVEAVVAHNYQESNDAALIVAAVNALPSLLDEVERLRDELETERMRVVACGVIALSNTRESAEQQRKMHPKYRCASVIDVERAVDREMALREEVERLRADAARYRWLRDRKSCPLAETDPAWDDLDAAIDAAMGGEKRE